MVDEDTGKEKVITDKDVKIEKHPDYIESYVVGTQGGPFGPYDFRMSFYDIKPEKDEDGKVYEKRILKSTVVMSYASAKQLSIWLQKHLRDYEEIAGHEIYVGEKKLSAESETDRA